MVELLVAMAIIGLLIATAIWGIGLAQQGARNTQRREAGAQLLAGMSEYYSRFNQQAAFGIYRGSTAGGALCLCDTAANATLCTLASVPATCYRIALNGITRTADTDSATFALGTATWIGTQDSATYTRWLVQTTTTGTKICANLEGGGYANLSEPQSITCP